MGFRTNVAHKHHIVYFGYTVFFILFRLVPEGQGSLAQGVQQTFGRFVGFIPAAPLFGSLIDKSCQLWHVQPCNKETTSCLEYDNKKFK